jgi:hypothetical protein
VQAALRNVPAKQRAVLMLRYYVGMTSEEAGDVLGVRAASVRSQTSRGLASLRAALAAGGVVLDEQELGGAIDADAGRSGRGDVRPTPAALRR